MAQQTSHGKAPKTHASTQAAEHESGGLPQLKTDDFAPQLVWLALTFGTLYWIMSRVALPRIAHVLETRRNRIASDLDVAQKFKQKSLDAETAYKTSLADAKNKAHNIAQETRDQLNAQTDAKRAVVDEQITAQLIEAEKRIKASKTLALKEVSAIATSTTGEIVNHLTGSKVSQNDLSNAIKSIATR